MNIKFLSGLGNLWGREPAAILFALRMIFYALVAWGIQLTENQIVATLAAVEAVLFVVTRQSVVSPATHVQQVQDALYTEPPAEPELLPEEIVEEVLNVGDR